MKGFIDSGRAVLGIEFGSTRIKAVLIGEDYSPIASGSHEWENRLDNNIWTYTLEDVWEGLQDAYGDLKKDVKEKYDTDIVSLEAIGFSAMMHGYMAFDKDGKLLVPFRTWRNTITGEAAKALSEEFDFNVPQRWSISHLYQAILNDEPHVKDIAFITTLAGYVHWQLTGEKVLGVGDASGMFPIDEKTHDYDRAMMAKFDRLVGDRFPWKLEDILPKVKNAGENAGALLGDAVGKLDVTGALKPGIPMAPPEGDAGTGMAATNSVRVGTGNVSAGTSIFGMVVTNQKLKRHEEIDMVTTPDGEAVAMVHCNNCTSDINAWVGLFREYSQLMGIEADTGEIYTKLFNKSLEGAADCNGLVSFNYLSGEPVTGFDSGRPMFIQKPGNHMNLADFMRTHIYSAMAALKYGMDILHREGVRIDTIYGHGGLFKTEGVAQSYLAAALSAKVSVMATAGEGGAWGMALLAAYMKESDMSLPDFLEKKVFADSKVSTLSPKSEDVEGFNKYMENYVAMFDAQRGAVKAC